MMSLLNMHDLSGEPCSVDDILCRQICPLWLVNSHNMRASLLQFIRASNVDLYADSLPSLRRWISSFFIDSIVTNWFGLICRNAFRFDYSIMLISWSGIPISNFLLHRTRARALSSPQFGTEFASEMLLNRYSAHRIIHNNNIATIQRWLHIRIWYCFNAINWAVSCGMCVRAMYPFEFGRSANELARVSQKSKKSQNRRHYGVRSVLLFCFVLFLSLFASLFASNNSDR